MSSYLETINESVNSGMDKLAQASAIQTNTDGTLQELFDALTDIENQLTEVENALEYTEDADSGIVPIIDSLESVKTELYGQIASVKDDLNKLISAYNEENGKNFRELYEKLELLQASLNKVNENVDTYYKNLSELIKQLENRTSKENKGLKNQITKESTNLSDQISEENTELSDQISEENTELSDQISEENKNLENKVAKESAGLSDQMSKEHAGLSDQIEEKSNNLENQITDNHAAVISRLQTVYENMGDYTENSFKELNVNLDADMKMLMDKMKALSSQIASAQSNLTDILSVIEDNNDKRQQEIREMFADTKNHLIDIEKKFTEAHNNLRAIIAEFREQEQADHEETLTVLETMENDMQKTAENNFESLMTSINQFEASVNDTLNRMQENIDNNLQNMQETIDSKLSQTDSKSETNFNKLNESLNSKLDDLSKTIADSFTATNEKIDVNHQNLTDSTTQNFMDLQTLVDNSFNTMNMAQENQAANIMTAINEYSEQTGADLDELKAYMEEQFSQVFTSVSNGKASLASGLLTIGTDIADYTENEDAGAAAFAEFTEAIKHSQDCNGTGAVPNNLPEGVTAWVDGQYITGTGEDNEQAYQNGFNDGKGEITTVLYNGVKKEYPISWIGRSSVSVSAYAGNRGPLTDSASMYVDIPVDKTPDGTDGTLVNINLSISRNMHAGSFNADSSYSYNTYVQDADGSTLATYRDNNTGAVSTANYTYQLIGTGYSYDTIRAGGSMNVYTYMYGDPDNVSYSRVSITGTVTYLVAE